MNYGFREKDEYSTYPYVLAGYVTEKLRGKTWEDDVTDTLFKALGMWDDTPLRPTNIDSLMGCDNTLRFSGTFTGQIIEFE